MVPTGSAPALTLRCLPVVLPLSCPQSESAIDQLSNLRRRNARWARLAAVHLLRLNDADMLWRCENAGGCPRMHLRKATRTIAGPIWGAILASHASEQPQGLVRTHFY